MNIEPAEIKGCRNCVVIEEGEQLSVGQIASFATKNGAIIVNDDEAGDDKYLVRFPGKGQSLKDYDQLVGDLVSTISD